MVDVTEPPQTDVSNKDSIFFDPVYFPAGYTPLDETKQGRWYIAEMPPGRPFAVFWTDDLEGFGFQQLPVENSFGADRYVQRMRLSVASMKQREVPAGTAFEIYRSYPDLHAQEVQTGTLDGVVADVAATGRFDHDPITPAATPDPEGGLNKYTVAIKPDDDTVAELLGITDQAMYIRSSQGWFELPFDDDSIDGMEVVDVDESFIDIFDAAEGAQQQLSRNDVTPHSIEG